MLKGETLVVYNLSEHPLRSTVRDHLRCFGRYAEGRCAYLNLAARKPPRWISEHEWDTVVFHTSFMGHRFAPGAFAAQVERARALRGVGSARIALPQDEFVRSEPVCEFIGEFEIDHVLSVCPENGWDRVYEGVDRDRTGISQVLTGYLSDETLARIHAIVEREPEREIAIGYRAWGGAPWLGRHTMLKGQVGDAFAEQAASRGIPADISTEDSGVLAGDDWFRFLARCRYTPGVEGGASILDHDGSVQLRTDAYLAEHEGASFEQVEAACFPGRDGEVALFMLSPRHLEACATRTCQVLIEGGYSGVLQPGEHYIELKRDFSNIDEVVDLIERDSERERITSAAHRDVVASGRYSYRRLVQKVDRAAAEARARKGLTAPAAPGRSLVHPRARFADRASRARVVLLARVVHPLGALAQRILPSRLATFMRG